MKNKSNLLILMLIATFFAGSSLVGSETISRPDNSFQTEPVYTGLAEAEEVSIVIRTGNSEPDKYGFKPEDIKNRVKDKLIEASIKVSDHASANKLVISDVPEMRIDFDAISIESGEKCIFTIRTSMAIHIRPGSQNELIFYPAEVWKSDSGIQIAECNSAADKVNSIVDEQIKKFIDVRALMKYGVNKADANQSMQQPKRAIEQNAKPSQKKAVEYKFLASKNGKVFHKPDCRSAARISAENLVGYASREEAIAAGKRPCKQCNP